MRQAIARALTAFVLVVVPPTAIPSIAQDGIAPMVIVPDHPNGVPVNGCYTANRNLFGPYRFSFCLHRPGTYSVRGGGVRCDGRMTWHTRGRDIIADIHRTSCNGGVAWERANMDCHPAGRIFGPVGSLVIRSLRCTYFPTVRGQRRQTFVANRN
jgi:hypothetical protein